MHRTTIGRAMAAGCLLAIAACASGSGVSAEEKPYVTALEESMTEGNGNDGDGFSLSDKQASCMAPKWIRTIGVDRLKAKGITPEDMGDDETSSDADITTLGLSEAEGGTLYDAFGSCDVDVKSLFIDGLSAEMSDEDKQCVDTNFSDTLLKKVLVAELINDGGVEGDPALSAEVQDALAKCPGAVTA